MFSFIPEQQKKIITSQYRLRLVSLCFFALTAVSLIFFFSNLPAYFYGSVKVDEAKNRLKQSDKDNLGEEEEKYISEIKNANELIDKLNVKEDISITAPIKDLILLKKNIVIKSVSAKRDTDGKIVISGDALAPSREDLDSFVKKLKADSRFGDPAVPISGFVKSSNINFSFTIKTNY